jgi:hypothetical protein
LLTFGESEAQNIYSVKVSGYVYAENEKKELKPLSFVSIRHKRRNTGTTSDTTGFFSINLIRGDTLLFTAVGFAPVIYVLNPTFPDKKATVKIIMKDVAYALQEVKIVRQKTVKPKADKVYVKPLKGNPYQAQSFNLEPTASFSPITALYNQFSKQGKAQRKLSLLQEIEAKEAAYKKRLNAGWVSELTRLEGEELEAFMDFCHPDADFVLHAEDYDLIVAILDCYDTFQQRESYYRKK